MSVNTKVNGNLVRSAGLYSVTKPIGMADIYSTEEKEVGVFTDGKPIYSKTVTATSNVATGDGSWADISGAMSPTISNAETLVDAQIHGTVNIDYSMVRFCIVDGVIKCASKVSGNGWYTGLKVTFFYTKTTDTPWSGKFVPQGYGYVSSGDIYSFEERQVGVFADGKPLYQKTIDFGELPNNTTKQVNHNVSNIETVVEIKGVSYVNNLIYGENLPPVTASKAFRTSVRESVVEVSSTDNWTGYNARITFRYTKTTDVAGSGEYVPSGDKAEHYSTDEEVIGTFLGETLYRKVFVNTGATVTCGANTWTTVPFASVPNLSRIIDASVYDENDTKFVGCISSSNNALSFYNVRTVGVNLNNGSQVVLEYTKTS